MSMSAFPYGTIAASASTAVTTGALITAQTISVSGGSPSPTAGYQLQYDGNASKTLTPGSYSNISGQWETEGAASENYDCYWTFVGGDTGGGPVTDTWLNFSGVGYAITLTKSGGKGTVSNSWTVKIRDANTLVELTGPVTISLSATRT